MARAPNRATAPLTSYRVSLPIPTCYDMGHVSFSDISFGMCLNLMSWVQQVHNAAIVARSLGCQCDTEIPGYPAYPGRLFYFRAAAARRLRVAVAVSFWAPSRSEATKAAAVTGGVRLGEELP